KRSREGELWRVPILLAAGRLAQVGDTGHPVQLLGELCGTEPDETEQGFRDVWMAGEVLAEVGANALRDSPSGREATKGGGGGLWQLVRGGRLTRVERAQAADALGRVGDPRFRKDAWYLPAGDDLGFVPIPAGPFRMGSDPGKDRQSHDDEQPQHR